MSTLGADDHPILRTGWLPEPAIAARTTQDHWHLPDGPDRARLGMTPEYDDGYATCARTFATLSIRAFDLDGSSVSNALGLEASQSWARGEEFGRDRLRRTSGGWSLTTDGKLDSLDVRRHIDWLLDRIEPHSDAVAALIADGARVNVFCYWESRFGSGGPMLSPYQSGRLASLGIDVGFDCYPPEAVWDALQAAPQVPPPGFPSDWRYF